MERRPEAFFGHRRGFRFNSTRRSKGDHAIVGDLRDHMQNATMERIIHMAPTLDHPPMSTYPWNNYLRQGSIHPTFFSEPISDFSGFDGPRDGEDQCQNPRSTPLLWSKECRVQVFSVFSVESNGRRHSGPHINATGFIHLHTPHPTTRTLGVARF